MNKTLILASFLFAYGTVIADDHQEDATAWYEDSYAPLWEKAPWDHVEAIASHYDETIVSHSADGSVETGNSLQWLSSGISEWKEEAWISSDVVTLETDVLNPTTAVFKSKWRDVYSDGSEEFSCGWYLADLQDGKWAFSAYADIDCETHKL